MALFALWFVVVFLLGICVGSFLNVCISRLPYEKTLFWPLRSRCGSCLQVIRTTDNIPLVSYLLLGGRCRTCHAPFSFRYLLVELGTGLAFVGLFYLEMVRNCLNLPLINQLWGLAPGWVPYEALVVFAHHAVLMSFLIVASVCDLKEMEIPLPLTLTGTAVGLILATLLPWPIPETIPLMANRQGPIVPPVPGAYAWPVWFPLPDWLPAATWKLGLATGLAGALAGMIMLRVIRYLFTLGRGKEGLGVGDADLMMMAGAFLGWQPILVSFLVGVFVGLFFAIGQLVIRGEHALPFGPALSLGVMITVLSWPSIGPQMQMLFFEPVMLGILVATGAIALVFVSFLLRLIG
jgi:leader peptidase (prepilin peptidase)/N-methyltransferase